MGQLPWLVAEQASEQRLLSQVQRWWTLSFCVCPTWLEESNHTSTPPALGSP